MFLLFEAVQVELFKVVAEIHLVRSVRKGWTLVRFADFRMLPLFQREVAVVVDGVGAGDALARPTSGVASWIAAVDAGLRFRFPLVGESGGFLGHFRFGFASGRKLETPDHFRYQGRLFRVATVTRVFFILRLIQSFIPFINHFWMNQWIEESYAVVFGSAGVQFGQFGFVGDISVGGVVVVVAGGHQQFPIALQSNPKTNEKKIS